MLYGDELYAELVKLTYPRALLVGILSYYLLCKCGSEQGFLEHLVWDMRCVFCHSGQSLKKVRDRDHSMELELGLSIVFPKDIAILNSVIYFFSCVCGSCEEYLFIFENSPTGFSVWGPISTVEIIFQSFLFLEI